MLYSTTFPFAIHNFANFVKRAYCLSKLPIRGRSPKWTGGSAKWACAKEKRTKTTTTFGLRWQLAEVAQLVVHWDLTVQTRIQLSLDDTRYSSLRRPFSSLDSNALFSQRAALITTPS